MSVLIIDYVRGGEIRIVNAPWRTGMSDFPWSGSAQKPAQMFFFLSPSLGVEKFVKNYWWELGLCASSWVRCHGVSTVRRSGQSIHGVDVWAYGLEFIGLTLVSTETAVGCVLDCSFILFIFWLIFFCLYSPELSFSIISTFKVDTFLGGVGSGDCLNF